MNARTCTDESRGALLIEGAGAIATLSGGLRRGESQGELAMLSGSADAPLSVATWEGKIIGAGPAADVDTMIEAGGYDAAAFRRLDAAGGLVTPGLIDSHTHLLFAGTREAEWAMRAAGAGYLEILEAGGGILSTVAATRAASSDDLLAAGRARLATMLANGTTTVEAKSGYDLTTAGELRLLQLADQLCREGPVQIVPTFLGAHAVPSEFRGHPDAAAFYASHVIEEQLPAVALQGIARFCDVFCEVGVFEERQSRRILTAARNLGLAIRLHADELVPSCGAELAAELGCCSADHLASPSDQGIDALAAAADRGNAVVATLLPATSWFLGKHHFADARRMIGAGIPVALATDLNPGTSPTLGLPLVMSIACLELGMTPAETLAAVTVNAAHALGMAAHIGSIEPGKQADMVVWDVSTPQQIPYWLGSAPVRSVAKLGRVVFQRVERGERP